MNRFVVNEIEEELNEVELVLVLNKLLVLAIEVVFVLKVAFKHPIQFKVAAIV